jgi:FRG domain
MMTSLVHEEDIADWSTFKKDVFQLITECRRQKNPTAPEAVHDDFLFRGQSCSTWELETAFTRIFRLSGEMPAIVPKYVAALNHLIEKNKYYRIMERPDGGNLEDTEFFEQLAQHFGFPTRLLDWSESPYIAAFFAMEGRRQSKSGKVTVWGLDFHSCRRYIDERQIVFLPAKGPGNERIRAQLGRFSRCEADPIALDVLLSGSSRVPIKFSSGDKPAYPILFKFNFSTGPDSESVMIDLEKMGINHIRMYPGFEGLCKYSEYVSWTQGQPNPRKID